MDNYKIKVKDEAESKEAQELFFALGVSRPDGTKNVYHSPIVFGLLVVEGLLNYVFDESVFYDSKAKELTLPQLRDLVVLKRNDVKDATHNNFRTNTPYLKQGENEYYMFNGEWVLSNCPNDLEPINQPKDPALISGDVALANVHKCIVQYLHDDEPYGRWTTITDHLWSQYHLGMFLDPDTKFKFRFKPQTIKVELELPKPFEPKEGDTFYYLSDGEECGFIKCEHDWTFDPKELNFGAYRTLEEIKQVVEQLRKIRGTNS